MDRGFKEEGLGEGTERLVSIIESLLLVTAGPIKVGRLKKSIANFQEADYERALELLEAKYSGMSGILLSKVAEGYQLRTNPANQEYVREFLERRSTRLSRAAMETLSVIAYRQPVTRAEVEDIRGVDCQSSIRRLVEARLIRVVGKKDLPGRPFLFGTTREFLEIFGLEDLSSLPSISDLEEILGPISGDNIPDSYHSGSVPLPGDEADEDQ